MVEVAPAPGCEAGDPEAARHAVQLVDIAVASESPGPASIASSVKRSES